MNPHEQLRKAKNEANREPDDETPEIERDDSETPSERLNPYYDHHDYRTN